MINLQLQDNAGWKGIEDENGVSLRHPVQDMYKKKMARNPQSYFEMDLISFPQNWPKQQPSS